MKKNLLFEKQKYFYHKFSLKWKRKTFGKKFQLKLPFQFISAMLCTHKNKSESIYWSDVCVAFRVLWNAMIFIRFEKIWIECLWFRFPSTQIPIWPTFYVRNFHKKKEFHENWTKMLVSDFWQLFNLNFFYFLTFS